MFGGDIEGKPVSPEFDATVLKQSYMLDRQIKPLGQRSFSR